MTSRRAVLGLLRSSHPMPSIAVTATAVAFAIAASAPARTVVLVGVAVLFGQFSVGWSNDRIDVERDRRVGHAGKPLVEDGVSTRSVEVAIALSLVATIVFSVLLGWRAGGLHLIAVASAWLYNAWLKQTVLSWLPYAVAFGALPAVATFALPGHPAPAPWLLAASAAIGVSANFLNAVERLGRDPRSDVHGLPDRIGPRLSLAVGLLLVLTAALLVTFGPPGGPDALAVAGLVISGVTLAAIAVLVVPLAAERTPFYAVLPIIALEIVVAAVNGHPLH